MFAWVQVDQGRRSSLRPRNGSAYQCDYAAGVYTLVYISKLIMPCSLRALVVVRCLDGWRLIRGEGLHLHHKVVKRIPPVWVGRWSIYSSVHIKVDNAVCLAGSDDCKVFGWVAG